MELSVIVPVYNAENNLTRCIESLIQAGRELTVEILLIDDGSTDHSLALCRDLEQRYPSIKVFHHQKNRGVSAARNTGIAHASGKYIIFVDADDRVEEHYLKALYSPVKDDEEVDLVITNLKKETSSGLRKAPPFPLKKLAPPPPFHAGNSVL